MSAENHVIEISDEQDKIAVGERLLDIIKTTAVITLEAEKVSRPCEISVTLIDNQEIRGYNRAYRRVDAATDVLSFPMLDEPYDDAGEYETNPENGAILLGDVALSLERAVEQAEEIGQSFERETAFLVVHSVLHLLGYDHESGGDEEERMLSRQRVIIEKITETCGINP